jgi:CxxC motif-containing protein (DUF1111 family)
MRRIVVLWFALFLTVTMHGQSRRRAVRAPSPQQPSGQVVIGDPLPKLTQTQRADFDEGRADFVEDEEVLEGLGPVFNERSCQACHNVPAVGGGSNTRTVGRFARRINGVFDPLANLGGIVMQDRAIGIADGVAHPFQPDVVPAAATIVTQRRSPLLFGLGYVDATPDADFIALAQSQVAAHRDGVTGRVNLVDNIRAGMKTVGRFGWKSQVPTLLQFAGDAYLNELGITSPDFPQENCPRGNCAELAFNPLPGINDDGSGPDVLKNFMSMLAPPPRAAQNRDTQEGEDTFEHIGCAMCHVPTLRTGASATEALDRKSYHPYSDFLLHDMGSLRDDLELGEASGQEFRTTPLWGLRFVTRYLHDGRATTLEQAILAHDGEARAAKNRYVSLSDAGKARLLSFLRSL